VHGVYSQTHRVGRVLVLNMECQTTEVELYVEIVTDMDDSYRHGRQRETQESIYVIVKVDMIHAQTV
jgi:hypothetical protein